MEPRIPPQNIDAEKSLLGSLLIDKDALIKVVPLIKSEYFYRPAHGKIYEAVLSLYERREPADIVTLSDELKGHEKLKSIGGDTYLAELVNTVATASNVEAYARIVRDCFVRRQLIAVSNRLTEKSYEGEEEVRNLLDQTEQEVFAISQSHLTRNFIPLKEALSESFERLEELQKSGSHLRGLSTGFRDIDSKLGGMRDGALVILAARPSIGKTSLALNIAQYLTVHEKIPVGFFSLESSHDELVDRLLSSQANVDAWKIATGNFNEEDFEKLSEAYGLLGEAPLFIDDTPGASIMEMRTKARRLQLEHGLKLVIVDYLQLAVSRNLENRVQEVSEITQGLKNLARELKCPVLAISQLSRAVESRGGEKRPQLSDLRESGSIEQESDVVMFLYRPEEEGEQKGLVKLVIAKHRNGPTGEVDLIFRGEKTRFYGYEKRKEG